jgi:hypothetical protein
MRKLGYNNANFMRILPARKFMTLGLNSIAGTLVAKVAHLVDG